MYSSLSAVIGLHRQRHHSGLAIRGSGEITAEIVPAVQDAKVPMQETAPSLESHGGCSGYESCGTAGWPRGK
jgi:hypothetical protein